MANCTNCGGPLIEGQAFCANCGQPVGAGAAPPVPPVPPVPQAPPAGVAPAAFTPPPQYQAPPAPYGQPPYGPGPGYPPGAWQPPRKSKKGMWIGIAASVLVLAVAAILVFVVFWDQISGGGSGPEQTVQKLLTAMEDKDIDGFFGVLAPGALDELTGGLLSEDELKQMFADEVFTYEAMKFDDVTMDTEITGDEATVVITGGTSSITEDGETVVEDVLESDTPVEFYLVKMDGQWYLDPSTFNSL